jgi:excinuclease ABC subunit A
MERRPCILVRGAREHNLQNLDIDLPRDRLIVITGPSGSGKSSLAFDTLFAEGQRRFLDTLRSDARAGLEQLQRPDVDLVEGLPPTLAVEQHAGRARPRSTLATLTEIHDHLRLLWARLGTPHCHQCGAAIHKQSVAEIVRQTLAREEGRKVYILAPVVRGRKGDHREVFQQIRQAGFLRARVNGVLTEVRDNPPLNPRQSHTVEMVVDRLVVRPGIGPRLTESIESAVKHGQGTVVVTQIDDGDWHDHLGNTRFVCPTCAISFGDLEPRTFSFNSPYGACPRCDGLGELCKQGTARNAVEDDADAHEGDGAKAANDEAVPCPECGGARLNREARSVRFEGKTLPEAIALTVTEARAFFSAADDGSAVRAGADGPDQPARPIRKLIVDEISHRLRFLEEVGLGYLTLDRPAPTLSGGEMQRARLATHLGAGLLGVCYILDEPTVGLHPRDTGRLLTALRGLQQRGNTVIVVEHDEEVIRQADFVVDIGPGPGRHGGRLVAQGSLAEVLANPQSVTAPFLRPDQPPAPPATNLGRQTAPKHIVIRGARHHNLKSIDVSIPLGRLVCVTGVSGSGKTSLARDILCRAARRHVGLSAPRPGLHDRIDGLDEIDKVIEVDQAPLGRSSRSSAATYSGIFDEVRKIFAVTREAKVRGYKANRFSFNVRGGRCEDCRGQGVKTVALHLLPDLTIPCATCRGLRFNRATLAIRYRGLSIADVLALSVESALDFFASFPALVRPLQALVDVGLGYLTLDQPSRHLSGGEAQRVKLATQLARTATGRTLFFLDEPTTGLHFADIDRLLGVFRRLIDPGNTLVVVEHNLDVIAAADWVIDLGPEAGGDGGHLVAAGTPADITRCASSITGRYLRGHRHLRE